MADDPIVRHLVASAGEADALVAERPTAAAGERCRLERMAELRALGRIGGPVGPVVLAAQVIAASLEARRLCLVCGLELPAGRLPTHPSCVAHDGRLALPDVDTALAIPRLEQLAGGLEGRWTYLGEHHEQHGLRVSRVAAGGRPLEIYRVACYAPPRIPLGRARAGGLASGYTGAGPADLALSLAADVASIDVGGVDQPAAAVAWASWRYLAPLVACLAGAGPWVLDAATIAEAIAG